MEWLANEFDAAAHIPIGAEANNYFAIAPWYRPLGLDHVARKGISPGNAVVFTLDPSQMGLVSHESVFGGQ
ncbi:MAG: hypothetical protein F6K11_06915 [Leptolyngbya sp. SIO3F4]|nr:hypothetical protein [Leptolyngbya sp. SIO3F4]